MVLPTTAYTNVFSKAAGVSNYLLKMNFLGQLVISLIRGN
jgi:hypothetical protein